MTTTINKLSFIKEWTPAQFKAMEQHIAYHFKNRYIRTLHGDYCPEYRPFKKLDIIFGLAYTSTGIWACYGVCNTEIYLDAENKFQYSYFVIGNDDNYYAILQDAEENELVIPLA